MSIDYNDGELGDLDEHKSSNESKSKDETVSEIEEIVESIEKALIKAPCGDILVFPIKSD